jgi:hypothetical protein
MLRIFEVVGDNHWLSAARSALHRDLDGCESLPDGTMQVRDGARVLPYLATGGAGIALVCDLLLDHAHDERVAAAVAPLSRSCVTEFCVGGGLFNGRAGLVGVLWQLAHRLERSDVETRIDAGIEALNLHALSDEHGLIFAGDQNLRASCDLATGSAGVLRLINVIEGRTNELLPFAGRERWTTTP